MAERKKQVRFSDMDDVNLLKEVLATNPFLNKSKWPTIAEAITRTGFVVDSRRARERTNLLVDQHKKGNAESRKQSGSDEDYGERISLLDEVLELKQEEERNEMSKREKKNETEKKGKEMRKRALETLSKDDDFEATPRKRSSSTCVIEYLKAKAEQEKEQKREEMKLKNEELKLEREKFELEKEERRQKMENERKDKEMMLNLMQKLINSNK